jgi:hypothetical protein
MARTFVRQATQIRKSDVYSDAIAPSLANYQTNSVSIEDDLNSLRSQVNNLLHVQTGSWYDDLVVPNEYDPGAKRGVNDLNSDLHHMERKRVLVNVISLADVHVDAGTSFVVLSGSQLPSNTTAAIGAVSTLGTVVAAASSFGAAGLDLVAGSTAISPKNLGAVVDVVTRDPVLSGGRDIFALFQSESSTDGSTLSGTAGSRLQISFVRVDSTGNALELVPTADIGGKDISFISIERKSLFDLNEQDFLRGTEVSVPSATAANRDTAYANQGTVPVLLNTDAKLDLHSAGIEWKIRDLLAADLLVIHEGSGAGASEIKVAGDVDKFTVQAIDNDFSHAIKVDSAGKQIDIGVSAGQIATTGSDDLEVHGAGKLTLSAANQVELSAGAAIHMADGFIGSSTWTATQMELASASSEWSTFKYNFGEVSLLAAINAAYSADVRSKTYAVVTTDVPADSDVSLADGNLDVALPDMSAGTFVAAYDLYLNGELLRPGANAAANNDYYPGSSLASAAKLKFEFGLKTGDVLCVVAHAAPAA